MGKTFGNNLQKTAKTKFYGQERGKPERAKIGIEPPDS